MDCAGSIYKFTHLYIHNLIIKRMRAHEFGIGAGDKLERLQ